MARNKKDSTLEGVLGILFILGFAWYYGQRTVAVTSGIVVILIGLAIAAYVTYVRIKAIRDAGMDEIDQMTGLEFEQHLAHMYQILGYKTKMTAAVGDQGGDLIIEKNGERTVVQAKRWGRAVGNKAVQEVTAAIRYYDADAGIVVTNSTFTDSAKALAEKNDIELIDRDGLVQLKLRANASTGRPDPVHETPRIPAASPQIVTTPAAFDACPRCSAALVKRTGKRGAFIGCSSFPRCRFTMDILDRVDAN